MTAIEQVEAERHNFGVYRLHTPQSVNLEGAISDLYELVDEVAVLDDSTWKVWSTAKVLHTDYDNRLFELSEADSRVINSIAISCPVYLRAHIADNGTTFTLVSKKDDAAQNVIGLLSSTYENIDSLNPTPFLRENGSLVARAARIIDEENEINYGWSSGEQPTIDELTSREGNDHQRLINLFINVGIEQAPITTNTVNLDLRERRIVLHVTGPIGVFKGAEELVIGSVSP